MQTISSAVLLSILLTWSTLLPATENLIENSSFEAGIDSRFGVGRWFVSGLPSADLDGSTSIHGDYSLRIPFSRMAQLKKPETFSGILVRAAKPIPITPGQDYSFSVYLKADRVVEGVIRLTASAITEHDDRILLDRKVSIGTQWRRFGLRYKAVKEGSVYWEVQASSDRPGYLWADALQLERGTFSAYEPRSKLEASLTINRLGKIFESHERPGITLMAYNDSNLSRNEKVRLRITSLEGAIVYEDTVGLTLAPQQSIERGLSVPQLPNGAYVAMLDRSNVDDNLGEVHFSILPEPRRVAVDKSAFGIYLTIAEEPLAIAKRLGFRWIGGLTSIGWMVYWRDIEPVENQFLWYDEDLALARAAGFNLMFSLEPCSMPNWAKALPRNERLRKWQEYVSAIAAHYKEDVSYWTIADEAHSVEDLKSPKRECWMNAEDYVLWHRAGYDAIKKANPDAKVILNARGKFADKVVELLGAQRIDILADNVFHSEILRDRAVARAERHGIDDLWAPGVSVATWPYYTEQLDARAAGITDDYWLERNRNLVIAVVETLGSGFKRIFQYTGTYVGNTNYFSIFEADSGLKPFGAQFGALIWLLDGISTARRIDLLSQRDAIRAYRFDRLDGKSIMAIFGGRGSRHKISLAGIDSVGVAAYDHFANPIELRVAHGGTELTVTDIPVFLSVDTVNADRLEKAIKDADPKMTQLPFAEKSRITGRYAKLTGVEDGQSRYKPNISLWYNSPTRGWIELMRYRTSTYDPEYRVTEQGFEITWNFERRKKAFFLEPGLMPNVLISDADYRVWRSVNGRREWRVGRVGNDLTQLENPGASIHAQNAGAGPVGYIFEIGEAEQLRIETYFTKNADPSQMAEFGGWRLRHNTGEWFLHQQFTDGTPLPIKIRVTLSVDQPDKVR